MIYRVKDFYKAIDGFAPFSSAESWDNAGLMVGSPVTEVTEALVALDLTADSLNEAKGRGANLIITHHPAIYPSLKKIGGESLLYRAIRENIAVISAHTNYDIAENGINDTIAGLLRLANVRVLESGEFPKLGRLGELAGPMTSDKFAAVVKETLNAKSVKYTQGSHITTAAICGGSGAELWQDAFEAGAQALVTSEVKHHVLLAAHEAGFTLIDAGHFATEAIAIPALAKQISQALPGAAVSSSETQKDPAYYA